MAFQQKEWKNRLSENPTRRLLTPVDGSTPFQVDVTRAEGNIMQQGDSFNADNMNDLEARIAAGIGGGDENMALIEEGPESANPYVVNDLLIYNGQLYKVIAAIAVGNSLVEGVNIEATTLGDEIKDIQDELTANGTRLYMDYKDGKYGYNTSPSRGADTFFPFSKTDHIRLNLYGYAYGWAEEYGNAHAKTTGTGTYKLSGTNVDHITGVSGSMTVAYTDPQGQSASRTLTAGQTIAIENANDITFSWSASGEDRRYSGGGNAETSVSASIVVDVYF